MSLTITKARTFSSNMFKVIVFVLLISILCGCRYADIERSEQDQNRLVMDQGDEDRRRYIELVRNVALVQKPEESPEIWYDAIPNSDIYPFEASTRTYEKHYKIVCAERQYLSFHCEDFFWDGGVYIPWPKYTVGSIDRKTGKVVTLDDIAAFADRSTLKKRLKDAVLEKMKDENVAARVFPHNNFYLAKDGWHFVYNAGDIDSLSTGPIEVVIERD